MTEEEIIEEIFIDNVYSAGAAENLYNGCVATAEELSLAKWEGLARLEESGVDIANMTTDPCGFCFQAGKCISCWLSGRCMVKKDGSFFCAREQKNYLIYLIQKRKDKEEAIEKMKKGETNDIQNNVLRHNWK